MWPQKQKAFSIRKGEHAALESQHCRNLWSLTVTAFKASELSTPPYSSLLRIWLWALFHLIKYLMLSWPWLRKARISWGLSLSDNICVLCKGERQKMSGENGKIRSWLGSLWVISFNQSRDAGNSVHLKGVALDTDTEQMLSGPMGTPWEPSAFGAHQLGAFSWTAGSCCSAQGGWNLLCLGSTHPEGPLPSDWQGVLRCHCQMSSG